MNENLLKVQDVVLERVNSICRDFGLNSVMAQLYVILYLSHRPLSLNEMCERLRISKGSVSVNIRALERYRVVRRIWVKGSRKDYYEAETNISRVMADRLTSMFKRRLLEVDGMLNTSSSLLNSTSTSGDDKEEKAIEVFKERVNRLKSLQKKVASLLSMLDSNLLDTVLNGHDSEDEPLVAKSETVS